MLNILISGALGKMGQVVAKIATEDANCNVVAGFDKNSSDKFVFPIYSDINDIKENIDVIIDFSNPAALEHILKLSLNKKIPAVLCTTGYFKADEAKIKDAAKEIPLFYSGNMSLGINLLIELSKKAQSVFGDTFDIEIIEQHHNQKIDAPSGTALMIADAIANSKESDSRYIYDRHSVRKKRDKSEIGIHSIRAGNIVGEHQVIFAGNDEILTITHSARSKQVFASGAVNAAKFIYSQKPGIYCMSDMLE